MCEHRHDEVMREHHDATVASRPPRLVPKGVRMEYLDFLELVQTRRSIRAFTADPVPDEAVDQIIEAARWAPSGANSQPWEFVVVTDKETKERIAGFVKMLAYPTHEVELTRPEDMRWLSAARPVSDPGWKEAPVLIVVCGDPRTKRSYPLVTQLARGEATFESSLANAFVYMTLAATALGLGCQWVSATSNPIVMPLVKDALGVPDGLVVYDMMALGHAAAGPKPRIVREREELVHHERYDLAKYRSDEQVTEFLRSLRR
jgi:nitroreductase